MLLLLLGMVLPTGCTYNSGEKIQPEIPVDSNLVSFSEEIIPLFDQSCNFSPCHDAGGPPPNLLPTVAYDRLWEGNYIDTIMPEESELMLWLLGTDGRLVMPPSGTDPEINSKVLTWITQGAKDN